MCRTGYQHRRSDRYTSHAPLATAARIAASLLWTRCSAIETVSPQSGRLPERNTMCSRLPGPQGPQHHRAPCQALPASSAGQGGNWTTTMMEVSIDAHYPHENIGGRSAATVAGRQDGAPLEAPPLEAAKGFRNVPILRAPSRPIHQPRPGRPRLSLLNQHLLRISTEAGHSRGRTGYQHRGPLRTLRWRQPPGSPQAFFVLGHRDRFPPVGVGSEVLAKGVSIGVQYQPIPHATVQLIETYQPPFTWIV